jgi:predicted PurR-regulated permease PerM
MMFVQSLIGYISIVVGILIMLTWDFVFGLVGIFAGFVLISLAKISVSLQDLSH